MAGFQFVVQENVYNPPTEWIGNSPISVAQKLKQLLKCMRVNWNFQRGEGSWEKSFLWGGGGGGGGVRIIFGTTQPIHTNNHSRQCGETYIYLFIYLFRTNVKTYM